MKNKKIISYQSSDRNQQSAVSSQRILGKVLFLALIFNLSILAIDSFSQDIGIKTEGNKTDKLALIDLNNENSVMGSLANPGSITGGASICANVMSKAYSIALVPGATGYIWIVPSDATIATGQGSNAITVNYGVLGGNVCVYAENACSTSSQSCLAITVSACSCISNGFISTIAGNGYTSLNVFGGYNGDGIAATSAELNGPYGVALDGTSNVYIADQYNNRIRKLNISSGLILTIAGNGPTDSQLSLAGGYNGDGIPATSAEVYNPEGVAVDGSGNIYIADTQNNLIRKVTISSGLISTIAGNYLIGEGYNGENIAATSAKLGGPAGVAVDKNGNVYIAEWANHRVRKVTISTGLINTIAGTGTGGYNQDGIAATNAQLNRPMGVAVDGNGNVYIADLNNQLIRKITVSTGLITSIAGNRQWGYNGDGIAATSAELANPWGVAVDGNGNVYVADNMNNIVREVCILTGLIYTIAGNGPCCDASGGYNGDGIESTSAELFFPLGVSVDASGNVYIADTYNKRIRKISH